MSDCPIAGPDPPDRPGIDCSVLMPVLNEERHIASSVDAMQRQQFPGQLEFLVVDGGSTDRTREILEQLAALDGRIRIFDNPRRIASSGLNVGLRHARGRWVARMDAHTKYPVDYLARGVERLEAGGTRWVSGPPIATGGHGVSRAVTLALATPLGRGGSRKWAAERSDRSEYELDAGVFAGVWERVTLLEYGGWDERWARNQDSEMAGRFTARGERLICIPAMAAEYVPRDSIGGLWRQYLQYGEFRAKTAAAHPNTMRRSHLLAPAIVVTTISAALAPAAPRRLARWAVATYLMTLLAAGAFAASSGESLGDASRVPVVLATMHYGHGLGMVIGAVRHGPPLAAFARAVGLGALAARLPSSSGDVFAPSLSGEPASR
ncbi:MAG: glycosyltransferase [Solirubrobacterales bacterium]|nr:glycosyltransferase [Solirubrobacterales bacterium]